MKDIYKIVEEELESTRKRIFTRINQFLEHGNQNSAHRSMKLQLKNRIAQTILTGEQTKGEGDTCIEVALVDSTGNIVDVGPEAFASVEIVLLRGEPDEADDWTVEKFNENIVGEMEGKKLLAGNEHLKLQRGIGALDNIKFRHCASKMRPSVFRLGARVVDTFDGVHIKEAKTECFTLKDFRNKYYKKHETPSLSDAVSRLANIRKGGKIDKRLQHNKIYTVEDFLIRYLIDPEGLQNSIVKLGPKKWEVTVNNARACPSDRRMYCYINSQQKTGIVFNVLGQVLGLYLKNQYAPTDLLSENHKAELLASAYNHWDDVKTFDDENSLQHYFAGLNKPMDLPDSLRPSYRGGMIGESSGISSFSVQSINSAMNSIREIGVKDFSSFNTDDVEIINDDFFQLSPRSTLHPETLFSDFDDFLYQYDNCNPNDDEEIAATSVTFAESGVVDTSKPPKRWKKMVLNQKESFP